MGTVVCEGTLAPVAGIVPTFTHNHWDGTVVTYSEPPYATDNNGGFAFHVDGQFCGEWYDVSLDPSGDEAPFSLANPVFISYGSPLVLDPIQVSATDVSACAPETSCVDPAANGSTLCTKLLRTPEAECAAYGLVPIVKIEDGSSTAAIDADLAMVKAGGCYKVFAPVHAGDTLFSADGKAISHVTYCACPPDA